MKQFISKKLNIQRLLSMGDLDVRSVAASNERLTAQVFFNDVVRFIEEAPLFADALSDASDEDQLNELLRLLSDIGYDKLNSSITHIIGEISADNSMVAKQLGAASATILNSLHERVKLSYLVKKTRQPAGDSDSEEPECNILLSEALEYWDYEEANRKLRVLAVDDIPLVLNTITSILSRQYEVFALTKAAQVEKFLVHTTPELFLLDIEMPDLNGYDLVSVIRSFNGHHDTPIIFLTGNATMENIKTAISLGACDFITKPVNRDILLEKISNNIVWKKAF